MFVFSRSQSVSQSVSQSAWIVNLGEIRRLSLSLRSVSRCSSCCALRPEQQRPDDERRTTNDERRTTNDKGTTNDERRTTKERRTTNDERKFTGVLRQCGGAPPPPTVPAPASFHQTHELAHRCRRPHSRRRWSVNVCMYVCVHVRVDVGVEHVVGCEVDLSQGNARSNVECIDPALLTKSPLSILQ